MRRTLGYPSRSYGVRYPPMRLVIVLGLWSCLLALAGVLALVWLAHARHFSIDLPDEIYLDARTWPSRSLLHATCVSAMLIGGAVGSVLGVVMWRWGRRFKDRSAVRWGILCALAGICSVGLCVWLGVPQMMLGVR